MTLYATTTSERASKGQGGNDYLNIVITIDEGNGERLFCELQVQENENTYDLVNKNTGEGYDSIDKTKGKKKKGETCEKCGGYMGIINTCLTCGKHN